MKQIQLTYHEESGYLYRRNGLTVSVFYSAPTEIP